MYMSYQSSQDLGWSTLREIYDPLTGHNLNIKHKSLQEKLSKLNKNCDKAKKIIKPRPYNWLTISYKETSKWDLIKDYIVKEPNVEMILSIGDTGGRGTTARNQMYETLWDILTKFGLISPLENIANNDITHYNGKIESPTFLETRIPDTRIVEYFKNNKIYTSSKDGVSDITFAIGIQNDDNWSCESSDLISNDKLTYYVTSVKYYDEIKSIDKFDIQNLVTAVGRQSHFENTNIKYIVITNHSDKFRQIIKRASRKYIGDNINYVFGSLDDLQKAYTRLYKLLNDYQSYYPTKQLEEIFSHEIKKPIIPKLHQKLIVNKTINFLEKGINKSDRRFLYAAVARSGKTFMVALLILELLKKSEELNKSNDTIGTPNNVVIISPYPTETLGQFRSVFENFNGFQDYTIFDQNFIRTQVKKKTKKIFLLSKQYLDKPIEQWGNRSNHEYLSILFRKDNGKDCYIFYDEAHQGGTTKLSDEMMDNFTDDLTKIIYLTATYTKVLASRETGIKKSNCFIWNYDDVQLCKRLDEQDIVEKLTKKFHPEWTNAVNSLYKEWNITLDKIQEDYQKYPDLYFLTSSFNETHIENIKHQHVTQYNTTFNMAKLLEVTNRTGIPKFRYEKFVNSLLNYIERNEDSASVDYKSDNVTTCSKKDTIYYRINSISKTIDSRTYPHWDNFSPNTQLWFLPKGTNDVNSLDKQFAMAELINNHKIFNEHYSVMLVSGLAKKDYMDRSKPGYDIIYDCLKTDNLLACIKSKERESYRKGKGLIILACDMLTAGVTLPCVDIVLLLDDLQSTDKNYQRMFRCLTESKNKKAGFVVDLNPTRIIKTLYEYGISKPELSGNIQKDREMAIKSILDLYYLDTDYLYISSQSKGKIATDYANHYLDIIKDLENTIEPEINEGNYLDRSRIVVSDELDKIFKDTKFGNVLLNELSKYVPNFTTNKLIQDDVKTKIEKILKKDKTGISDLKTRRPPTEEDEEKNSDDYSDDSDLKTRRPPTEEDEEKNSDVDLEEDLTKQENAKQMLKDLLTIVLILSICDFNCQSNTETKSFNDFVSEFKGKLKQILRSKENDDNKIVDRDIILQMLLLRHNVLPDNYQIVLGRKGKIKGYREIGKTKDSDILKDSSQVLKEIRPRLTEHLDRYYPNLINSLIDWILNLNTDTLNILLKGYYIEFKYLCQLRNSDKRKFITFVNKQLLPVTEDAKKIRGDIFTPITLIDGNYNSSVDGLADESIKTDSSDSEPSNLGPSILESLPTESSIGEPLEDVQLQSVIAESKSDSQLTPHDMDRLTGLNKDIQSISSDRDDSYTNKYCYRKQGKDGVIRWGKRKGQLKPGWSCEITDDSSMMENSYCTYDQGKCRPNCYYNEGKQHRCHEVKDKPFGDDTEKCMYKNGCKTLHSKKEYEKLFKTQEGKQGGGSNNYIKQYYREHQGQLKNSYSKILDKIPLNNQDYNVINGLISQYKQQLGGMDKSLFGNIMDTMGSYTQTRNLVKYGIIPDVSIISNTVKSKLYKRLI